MKLYKLISLIVALALMLAAFTPSPVSAQDGSQTIVEIAAGSPDFSTLAAAVQAAGLVDTLNSPGPFTVFAPTNAAFAKLGQDKINSLLANPESLSQILLYHVVPGKLMAEDVLASSSAMTAANLPVAFTLRDGKPYINNAQITATNINASNGVIHVIDRVILPPTRDIVDTLASRSNFKALVASVKAAGLVETLKSEGPFTVFAPTDAAFAKLGVKTVTSLLKSPDKLRNILLYHAVPGAVFSGDARKLSSATMANGQDVAITMKHGIVFINNARVVTYNILTTNGVIHVIDTVLLPESRNIVQYLAGHKNFETLSAAIKAAGLEETLMGADPFTIFAPTDDAFAKLPAGTVEALLADPELLKSILLYHAVPGKLYAGDVVKLTRAATVNGADVVIKAYNDLIYINNARVTTDNIRATNGVIHAINTVLLPPTKDIVDTAAANPKLKTLVAAVQAAGLVDTLKGDGPFTIFAPTDSAFAKLPAGTVEALLADPDALQKILLYHAVAGEVFSSEAVKLTSAPTINGAEVMIMLKDNKLYINDAQVIVVDVLTTNGVIHIIDTVLLPPAE